MVVAAGGFRYSQSSPLDTVQIFDVDTETWRMSEQSLPDQLTYGAVVQLDDTFLIVGGKTAQNPALSSDRILQFEPDSETWIERGERLALPRDSHMAVLVDERPFIDAGLCQ